MSFNAAVAPGLSPELPEIHDIGLRQEEDTGSSNVALGV